MSSPLRRSLLRCAALLSLSLASAAQAEDLTVVSQSKAGEPEAKKVTSYYSASKYRRSDADHDVIIDYASGKITNLDHKSKRYSETTLAELQKQMEKMTEQMKSNPAAAQAMEKMLGPADQPLTLKKVEGSRKIAGYSCDHYVLAMGEALTGDLWTTSALPPPQKFFEVQKTLMNNGPLGQRFGKMYEQMKNLKGYPLAQTMRINLMGQQHETSEEATSVKKGALPASAFAIPTGYTKAEKAEKTEK